MPQGKFFVCVKPTELGNKADSDSDMVVYTNTVTPFLPLLPAGKDSIIKMLLHKQLFALAWPVVWSPHYSKSQIFFFFFYKSNRNNNGLEFVFEINLLVGLKLLCQTVQDTVLFQTSGKNLLEKTFLAISI